ncbi:MAG: 23S rRNA (uracil(1939)-C(5))-methyltransferase RlmD [Lachnospiraceae bacterium]|nr:23S rRNA (uracil(1939)-C(5))-methyltransferase RlmD [Ruminococcus sp.]MCM1274570.1 23S rRNA (uracil(1939)-C(5))-methyltransferase RlmD [Lachnospiraceae bacterium]
MKKNDIITLEITSLASGGSGVGRAEGMAVFVPFTAVGDVIECRVLKVLKNCAYGKTERILTPSPDRIESDCPVFGKCGGCVYRHITYRAELAAKERIVRDAFERLGGLSPEFLPIIGSESAENYRNKLQMPVGKDENGNIISGFFSERSHRIVPVESCKLQPGRFSEITAFIKEQMKTLKISVYNERENQGVMRHIFLRKGHYSGEICAVLVARRKTPELKKLAAALKKRFPEITGVVLNVNPDRTNVILGEREILLSGKPEISDTMCGISVEISPRSFYQVNTPAAESLYKQAAEFAEPEGKTILDLYCGAGTIGLSMAGTAKKIIGAEIVPEAVENAKRSAAKNGIANAEFICADASKAAEELLGNGLAPDVIILDPPRKGCDKETLSACVKMSPERIVMISCDPATAARDCKLLAGNGYSVEKVRAFDLFPRTRHVECVTLMTKQKGRLL